MNSVRSAPKILIIGRDSLIGSALGASLSSQGICWIGTTQRVESDGLYLDLANMPPSWEVPGGVEVAVLAAAITSKAKCDKEPDASRVINVDAVRQIAATCSEKGVLLVFLSTSEVFGSGSNHLPDDPKDPLSHYGIQKALAENAVQDAGENSAILRLSKVIHPAFELFVRWRFDLAHSRTIVPLADKFFAPISLDYATYVLSQLVVSRYLGIYHLSSSDMLSYCDVSLRLAELMGVSKSLIDIEHSQKRIVDVSEETHRPVLKCKLPGGIGRPASAASTIDRVLWEMLQRPFAVE